VDQFATEEQQVEAIKRFWKENGVAIIAGGVIGVGGLGGWRYYTDSQIASKEAASANYQVAVESTTSSESVDELSDFVEQTSESGYKVISQFVLAKQYVEQDELSAAVDVLQNIIVAEKDSPLAAVAALRLAAVQMQQGQYDSVLSTLGNVTQESFAAQASSLKGDALVALTRNEEAKEAYTEALKQAPDNQQVKMKLDNLAFSSGV
jgi:predicted negative regulator of RcsB-dependent stress response